MPVVLLDLAAHVQQEGTVRGVDDLGADERADRREDLLPVGPAGGVDHDVAQAVVAVGLDQVDRADDAARLSDRGGEQPEDALGVIELDADRKAILGAWCCAHWEALLGSWRLRMLGGIDAGPRLVEWSSDGHRDDRGAQGACAHGRSWAYALAAPLPDRRPEPRLSRLLRAPRVDRDVDRGADQRDLRLRF